VADGQEEACERIVSARDNFEHPPIFLSTSQEELKHQSAPPGFATAPDNGPKAWNPGSAEGAPNMRRLTRCGIEPAESGVVRKPPRREKITTQVWGRVT
jgi:hypothetical protein